MNEHEELQDIYQAPGTEVKPHDTGGRFSGVQSPDVNNAYDNTYVPSKQPNGNAPYTQYPYVNNSYGQYQNTNAGNPYGQDTNVSNPYIPDTNVNNPYFQDAYTGNPYGQYQNANNQYGPYPNGSAPYGQYQYGYNNSYGPYAAPPKKRATGLIAGVIITVVVLFLIALFALFYQIFESLADTTEEDDYTEWPYYDYDYDYGSGYGHDYGYDNGFGYDYGFDNGFDYDYGYGNGFGYDYGYGNGYDYNYDFEKDYDYSYDYDSDEYYTLHDDTKKDMSYSIEWESYEYDGDKKNVSIIVDYPVIKGENVPNLDKINETIAKEVEDITDYYEQDYARSLHDENSSFSAYSGGYVTYMSEDILSIAFSEYIYSGYEVYEVYLKSINIDMKDGVILDNTGIIDVDDDFSVDFRTRSNKQNGPISAIDGMADQEITKYLTSADNLIIFYVPQGMEIGFNYSDGWVTVTYKDYEDFLKIF